ncbi:uncharacterized protein N7503_000483 [Penicillium pulvis]|uniref:uncharacterized protein n=1 Tax=Penicillium pulvis TaxID=1562058 RepID=UPI0025490BB3|nr:uncharacterized protein N7503_000483 [Penicillium pulvis]KAJ5813733.1 hypothetical protein N7503_000483 [Penicillium pulvis]
MAVSQTKNQSDNSKFSINFQEYSRKHVIKAANLSGAVLTSLLPVITILVLYLVEGMGARLGLVALFSTFFSACLWFLNDGNMVEVFSATSAFAAVQVVFIRANG